MITWSRLPLVAAGVIAISLVSSPSHADDPFDVVASDTVDEHVKLGFSRVVHETIARTPQVVKDGTNHATKDVREALKAYKAPPTILQSHCFTLEGTGQLDCFQTERTLCTEPGSQLVVRAIEDNSTFGASRVSGPFCSTSSDPVTPAPAEPVEGEDAPPPMPVVTLEDFQQLNIAPSTIEADSGGFGLRNAHTNFYATAEAQTLNVEMLGQDVAIQAVPVQWTWNYGDGSAAKTLGQPGGPQPEFNQELDTTHRYTETGTFPVNLTTAYRGQYSVNNGPWLPIPGTAQVPSQPVTADIWRSKTRNVADDCNENPNGWACGSPFIED